MIAAPAPAISLLGSFDDVGLPKPPNYDEADVSDKPAANPHRPRITAAAATSRSKPYACGAATAGSCRTSPLRAVPDNVRR